MQFPHQVRAWPLRSPELFNEVISVVVDSISFFYEQHSALVLGKDHILEPTAGCTVSGGSSLAPNPHLHMMFLDGVFARTKDGIRFFEHQGIGDESMFDVLEMIYLRLAKLFEKKGFVMVSGEASVPEDFDSEDDLSVPRRSAAISSACSEGLPPQRTSSSKSYVPAFRSRCDVSSRLA